MWAGIILPLPWTGMAGPISATTTRSTSERQPEVRPLDRQRVGHPNGGQRGIWGGAQLPGPGHGGPAPHQLRGHFDLKYARWTGSAWEIQTVDSQGDWGEHSSLALDADGRPHISYHDA